MSYKKALLFSLSLLAVGSSSVAFAQGAPGTAKEVATVGKVSGTLKDAQNAPVSYATVTLMRKDSSIVNGDLSKDDGSFSIAPTGLGDFLLRVESIGVTTRFFNVSITADKPERNMGSISLSATSTSLKQVDIVAEKPVVQLKVDKKVFNVEKNITSSGGSATDVLQNVPSVSVGTDGDVSLRGKSGVTILIDGKPATMLGSDVASALQSLPASSIESVEVITNPSAKYDAQGTTGIINIITKKDGRLGINGNITLGAGTRDKYNGNAGINIRKGKWSAFANASFRLNRTFNNVTTDRTDKATVADPMSYHTYEHVPRQFNGTFNSLGVTYDPNKFNSFTFTQNINVMTHAFQDYSDYTVYPNTTQSGQSYYHQYRYSNASGGPVSFSSAFDYKHKFKKKDEELNIDATFAATNVQRVQDYITRNDSNGGTLTFPTVYQNAPSQGGNNSLNAWADYTNPLFTKNGKLGMGVKTQIFWFNSNNTMDGGPFIYTDANNKVVDNTLRTKYDYIQQIHAAYVNWSDQVGKFSYQLGLRGEIATYDGNYETSGPAATLHNSFENLFPSAFFSYQLKDQQSVYLNYSRRVNRPNFFQLIPYLDLSNPSTVSTGNPALIPEFINNIEVSYSRLDKKGNNIILSAYYQYTENLIERITQPDTSGLLRVMPQNIASGTTFGVEGIGNLKFTPIWDGTVNVNLFQNSLVIGENASYSKYFSNNSGFGWFGKFNTNLKLPKNFSLQMNANYESQKVISQGNVKDSYWIDLALKKSFLNNKVNVVINCSDIFKTRRFINNYYLSTYDQTINRVKETRIGNISITYRFGKSDFGKNIAGEGMKRSREESRKKDDVKPNTEDRGKNMKEGDNDNDQSGGGGAAPAGGGKKESK